MNIELIRGKEKLTLTDEDLDNDNFIDLRIKDEDGDEIETIVNIEDLYAGVKAFYEMRTRRQVQDNLLKESTQSFKPIKIN
jgi:hypothetical protein